MRSCRQHWRVGCAHACEAVRDVGLRDALDSEIWRWADENGAVIITKDDDFVARVLTTPSGPAVVWLKVGNVSNPVLIEWLRPLLSEVIDALVAGERLVEVR
jgi:predicted nuclease of predicted toxin-antitoxin system